MIKYPNGQKAINKKQQNISSNKDALSLSCANRGMRLEDEINETNTYYKEKGLCLIYKRPTPIRVLQLDYTNGVRIKDAIYEKKSTTDYNGVYQGRYIDIEAKSTLNKTSFPLANISEHQLLHLERVIKHGGIALFIIEFTRFERAFILTAQYVLNFIKNNERKSITLLDIEENGYEIKRGYAPRLDYLPILQQICHKY